MPGSLFKLCLLIGTHFSVLIFAELNQRMPMVSEQMFYLLQAII